MGTHTPRTRNPERTRKQILDAAMVEFTNKGIEGARTDDIARAAGVSKRMLFHYFNSKDGLFQAVLEKIYLDIRSAEESLDLAGRDPLDAMTELCTFSFEWFAKHPEFIAILNEENLHGAVHAKSSDSVMTLNMPLVNTISKLLKRGETAGQFRPDVDPVELYISIAGVSYLYFSNLHTLSEIFGRDLSSKEELKKRRQHVVDVILGYLCHPVSQPSVTVDKSRKKSNEN
ncbi:TetR/AcrR family transcriptional regulator [uncultured Sneathiella sp.]|jgi:AcrR family transcriptional regulator|uniref:TetR/AcrR family transcriptional regulator n=1 Tax=uncultured Sneathiella sp. TaxID=879315 RepID=UPI0030D85CB6|tara:strand:+ start:23 stop:712 length:690 start_codon:yes stop_codon:yes gene_type:complete